jgi:predicted Mrr-cat superfamily restriction endonuclease
VVLPRKLTSQVALGVVTGPYKYAKVGGVYLHSRLAKWTRPDVPRIAFRQDLLSSLGAFMPTGSIVGTVEITGTRVLRDGTLHTNWKAPTASSESSSL